MSRDPWVHIQNGDYAIAVEKYSELIDSKPDPPFYSNRGIAHLNLGELQLALKDFQSAHHLQDHASDRYRQWTATVYWLLADYAKAQEQWTVLVDDLERGNIQYSDGSGGTHNGCFLWFASTLNDLPDGVELAERSMKRLLGSARSKNWPGPVAAFILNQIDADTLRSCVSEVDARRRRESCQVDFYAAIKNLRENENSECQKLLQQASSEPKALIESEFYLAQHELRRHF